MINLKYNSGFTLIEVSIVIAIFATIMTAVTLFALNISKSELFFTDSINSEAETRQAYKTIISEVRSMGPSVTGSYAISSASSSSFSFYSDTDGDGLAEQIRYFVDSKTLKKGTTKPSGNPLSYNPVDEKITELVHDVTSDKAFSYFDSNYDGSQSSLGVPVNLGVIRMVKIELPIDKDPNSLPSKVTLPVYIDLRNLRGI